MKNYLLWLSLLVSFWSGVVFAGETVDEIIAIVGDEIILQSDLRKARAMNMDLEELIREKLLTQEVARLDIEISPAELQQALAAVLAQNRMTLPQLKAELATKGTTLEDYKEQLRQRLQVMRFIRQYISARVEITEDDFEVYRRRFPDKAKRQSRPEMEQAILENKSKQELDTYLQRVRERSYVEIK